MVESSVIESIEDQINKSKREVTILFSDIKGSTEYWETHGDTAGRLMIDRHNKLLFPVVRMCRGTVVKTIGDSIMATFRKPDHALQAAIGMQQVLSRVRAKDQSFAILVRIGIHTGKAIIEESDVYGDVVNTAARVEAEADGDQILITQQVVDRLKKTRIPLMRHGSFTPRGKDDTLELYSVPWHSISNLTDKMRGESMVSLDNRQRLEQVVYALMALATWAYVLMFYMRYLLADFEWAAINPINPMWRVPAVGLGLAVAVGLAVAIKTSVNLVLAPAFFKLVKGAFGLSMVLLVMTIVPRFLPAGLHQYWDGELYSSRHLVLRVMRGGTRIYERPSIKCSFILVARHGDLFPQADVVSMRNNTWTKVLIRRGLHGWVRRFIPPRMGQARIRLTESDKFVLHWYELYALLLGLLGFLWGYRSFRIRPV